MTTRIQGKQAFRIIAIAAGREAHVLSGIVGALVSHLDAELSDLTDNLAGGGSCIAITSSLDEARSYAQTILRCGADYRILDESGASIDDGYADDLSAPRANSGHVPRPKPAPSAPALDATMIGGFDVDGYGMRDISSIGMGDLLTLDEATSQASPELLRQLREASVDEPSFVPRPAPNPNHSEALPNRTLIGMMPPAIASQHGNFSLHTPQTTEPPSLTAQSTTNSQRSDQAGEPNNLDYGDELDALVMLDGTVDPGVSRSTAPSPPPPNIPSPTFAPEEDLPIQLAEQPPRFSGPATRSGEGNTHPPATPAASSGAAEAFFAHQATKAPQGASVIRSGNARRSTGWSQFRGRIKERPRTRIILGFVFALSLGSVIPLVRAQSTSSSKIEVLRVARASATAYGKRFLGRSSYENIDAIDAKLERVLGRERVYTAIIWLLATSLLLFLWFRLI